MFSLSVELTEDGRYATCNPLSISLNVYDIASILNVSLLFAISVSIALIIAVFNEVVSFLIAFEAVIVLKPDTSIS
ncbi:hypothetical protein J6P59_04165 [bacterium]|nr:hypothetical protein [bacterium]